MIKAVFKQLLPEKAIAYVRQVHRSRAMVKVNSLPILTEGMFSNILINGLGLKAGKVVFIHSSIGQLNLGFPFYRILDLVQQIIGDGGTMLFPTYPRLLSYDYLLSGEIFDVGKTPSYTGILTEFARRQKGAARSLHPTKSVCAIGRYAQELTNTHQNSPYPYDRCSPYYKIMEYDGRIIGLGVSTKSLSFVHCVDDALKEEFPVEPYHKQLFATQCINYKGKVEIVKTYAHDLRKMNHNIPKYMRKYIQGEVCKDIKIHGMNFFRANARELFNQMVNLAKRDLTIYPKISYKRGRLI